MIIPGPMESDFDVLREKLSRVDSLAKVFQIDIADGSITKGKSFTDYENIADLETKLELELHLMLKDPFAFLLDYDFDNVKRICAHVEGININAYIELSKSRDKMTGLSISPDTDVATLDEHMSKIDYVQFMTVIPGAQGQAFRPDVVTNINKFRNKYPNVRLQTDGSMNIYTVPAVKNAGVQDQVVGSYLFTSNKTKERFLELSEL